MASAEWRDLAEPLQAALSDAWAAKQKAERLSLQQQAEAEGAGGASAGAGSVGRRLAGADLAGAGFVGQVEWLLVPSGQGAGGLLGGWGVL